MPEQIPLNLEVDWKNNPNIKPVTSKFPDSDNIINIEFRNGEWIAIYKSDDAGEMYRR